jgi:hypothetical protein
VLTLAARKLTRAEAAIDTLKGAVPLLVVVVLLGLIALGVSSLVESYAVYAAQRDGVELRRWSR